MIVRPLPDDPIAAARGALKGRVAATDKLRERAREEDAVSESCR